MSDSENKIDIEWYAKRADKLLDLAWDEYKQVTYDRHRIQHAILRNYLWLATAIFSAECVGFSQIFDGVVWFGLSLNANLVFNIFAFLSVACAFVAMAFGIDTMRGKDIIMPFCGWGPKDFVDTAWHEATGEAVKGGLYLDMLDYLTKATSHNLELAMRKGKRLRCMSYMLLVTLGTGMCAMLSAVIVF